MDWNKILSEIDWPAFIERVGFPAFVALLLILAALWLFARYFWPFLTVTVWGFVVRQWEDTQRERREEHNRYLSTIGELTQEIRRMAGEVAASRATYAESFAFYTDNLATRDTQLNSIVGSVDNLRGSIAGMDASIDHRLTAMFDRLLLDRAEERAATKTKRGKGS